MRQYVQTRFESRSNNQTAVVRDPPRRVDSADLLQGEKRLIIEHGESDYTLLLTRNGKLILTK